MPLILIALKFNPQILIPPLTLQRQHLFLPASRNLVHPFGYVFTLFSTRFQHLIADFRLFLLFFVFSLESLYFVNKPNPKGIFIKCRYSDKSRSSPPRQKTNILKHFI
jgi:hypothetical protein